MGRKLFVFLVSFIFIVFLIPIVNAEITTLSGSVFSPGDTILLTIKPTTSGFYNIINVHDADDNKVVDAILVNCATICTKKSVKVSYVIPSNFLGNYYFATFDYAINNYELDFFSVISQGEAPSGNLVLLEVRNTNSGINGFVNPEQGRNANITIISELSDRKCDSFSVNAYLCNSTLMNSCTSGFYNYKVPLNFVSKVRSKCTFNYIGDNYFPFYQKGGDWKAIVVSGVLYNEKSFVYTSLKAINYTSIIDFGQLNAKVWNVGIPSNGIDLINFGNLEAVVDWTSNGFSCVSENCTDFWSLYTNNEDNFQIDDDNLFAEEIETGLNPIFITNYSLNYFPQSNLAVCLEENCNSNIGERVKTYYNLKIPDIQRGVYQGDVFITSS